MTSVSDINYSNFHVKRLIYEISGKELVTAFMTGDDFAVRVLAATGSKGLLLGWDYVGIMKNLIEKCGFEVTKRY